MTKNEIVFFLMAVACLLPACTDVKFKGRPDPSTMNEAQQRADFERSVAAVTAEQASETAPPSAGDPAP